MSVNVSEPVTRAQAWLVVTVVTMTLSGAAYIYALQSQISAKADASSLTALKGEMRDIKNLLCNTPENSVRLECRRSQADYHDERA